MLMFTVVVVLRTACVRASLPDLLTGAQGHARRYQDKGYPPKLLPHLAVSPYGSMKSGSRSVIISISSGVVPKCTKVAPVRSMPPRGKPRRVSHVSLLALDRAWSAWRAGPHASR